MHLILILALSTYAPDPYVLAALRSLATQAANPTNARQDVEVAAFLVRDADGNLSCVLWPNSAMPGAASFQGFLPEGTIAFAHTHPPSKPEPSHVDITEAKRLQLRSYVLTRRTVYVIEPSSGRSVRLIQAMNWSYPTSVRCDCRLIR